MNRRKIAVILLFVFVMAVSSGCTQNTAQQPDTTTVPTEPTTVVTQPTPPPTEPSVPQPEKKTIICIDAGHQQSAIWETEPIGPGATEMKTKLSSGTQGVSTGIPEYQLNLDVSLLLEQELIQRGYEVVMIRRTNDCPLSNAERAQIANESGAALFVRIHANGAENANVSGMLC